MSPKTNKSKTPEDQKSREQIVNQTSTNLFVEAGAGTGKTTSLVGRVEKLVRTGVPCENILIITFTNKATGELKSRIRKKLGDISYEEIDKILISTIHSFTQSVLNNYPTLVGLPYNFSLLDSQEEQNHFIGKWKSFVDNLDTNDQLVGLALSTITLIDTEISYNRGHIFNMAKEFQEKWHILDGWDLEARKPNLEKGYESFVDECEKIVSQVADINSNHCTTLLDNLTGSGQQLRMRRWSATAQKFTNAALKKPLIEKIPVLLKLIDFPPYNSKKKATFEEIKSVSLFHEFIDSFSEIVFDIWIYLLTDFTLARTAERVRNGQVIYHDLLVLALRLLKDETHGTQVLKELAQKHPYILIDEFQDTDPIQLDIATLISEESTKQNKVDTSLMVVGDPKQSIYGFRGADVDSYRKAKDSIPSEIVQLTQNFRTLPPILNWINKTIGTLLGSSDTESSELQGFRQYPQDIEIGPTVTLLKSQAKEEEAENVALGILWMLCNNWKMQDKESGHWREVELRDICILVPARTNIGILFEALEKHGVPYQPELGEIVYECQEIRDLIHVLYALENPNNDFAVVRAMRTPLFGVSDDELYAHKINEQELGTKRIWSYLDPAFQRKKIPENIRAAFKYLATTYERSKELEPSQLIQQIIHNRLVLEVAKKTNSKESFIRLKRQLEIFVNIVSTSKAVNLTELLETIQSEMKSRKRFSPPQAETADAVRIMTMHASKGLEFPVVILANLHSGLSNKGAQVFPSEDNPNSLAISFHKKAQNQQYQEHEDTYRQQNRLDKNRTLYVAATRARDHLLTTANILDNRSSSLAAEIGRIHQKFDKEHKEGLENNIVTNGVVEVDNDYLAENKAFQIPQSQKPEGTNITKAEAKDWEEGKIRTLEQADARSLMTAGDIRRKLEKSDKIDLPNKLSDDLAVEKELDDANEDDNTEEESTFSKGWGWSAKSKGSDFGNTVHNVMQYLDFKNYTDEDIEKYCKQFAQEFSMRQESISSSQVEMTVRNFLGSATIAEATTAAIVQKEIQLQTSLSNGVFFRGFVDLLYSTQNGDTTIYNIVDFKTISQLDSKFLDNRMDSYKYQGASYVMALQEILKSQAEPDSLSDIKMSFLFGNEEGVELREMSDSMVSGIISEIKECLPKVAL